GTNDFSALSEPALDLADQYGGIYAGGDPAPLINSLVADFTTALDTIAGPAGSPTGVQVIVGNVGDWGAIPYAQLHGYTNPTGRANVTSAVIVANEEIRAIALARGMPIVDIQGLLNLETGASPLTIGDVSVILSSAPSDDQHYFTLPDKIHPGTLWQGLLANAIIDAANVGYGANLTPFSDQELLAHAGIADPHGGALTSYFPVSPYVETVPEPSSIALAVCGACALVAWRVSKCRKGQSIPSGCASIDAIGNCHE
ncbi:MAG TPA: hypothetical protein VGJ26_02035, partial [Pirellulales bacterium]